MAYNRRSSIPATHYTPKTHGALIRHTNVAEGRNLTGKSIHIKEMRGGGFFSDAYKWTKKAYRSAKHTAKNVGKFATKYVAPTLATAGTVAAIGLAPQFALPAITAMGGASGLTAASATVGAVGSALGGGFGQISRKGVGRHHQFTVTGLHKNSRSVKGQISYHKS